MHKIHHKIFLGIAAIAVVVGIVYIANLTRGQDCPPTVVTLSEANPSYTLADGSELSLDTNASTYTYNLISKTNLFSIDNWLPEYFPKVGGLALNQITIPATLYIKNIATGVVTEATIVNVNMNDYINSTLTLSFPNTTCVPPPCVPDTEKVVLSKATSLTYTFKNGVVLNYDSGAYATLDNGEASFDGGITYVTNGKLYSMPADVLIRDFKTSTVINLSNALLDQPNGTLSFSLAAVNICGPKDADKDGVADEVDQCPGTVADTITTLKPNNLAVFNVNGVLTWMANIGTAKKPNIVPAKAVSLIDTRGCSCVQIIDYKQTKESIDDKNNEDQGNYNDSDREDNKKRDSEENDSRLKFGCPSLGGKDNTKVTGIVGDWIKKAAKWSDDRKHDDNDKGDNREGNR